MIQLLVARETPNQAEVARLIRQADTELAEYGLMPFEGRFLAQSNVRVFAARFGFRVVGYGVLLVYGDTRSEILRVYIDVPGRRRGMGRALVDAMERAAWDEDCRRVQVVVPQSLADASAFFSKMGYVTAAPFRQDDAERKIFLHKPLQNPKPAGVVEGNGISYLCRIDDIADPGAKGVMLGRGEKAHNVVVAKKDGIIRGFVNSCPHWGTPLEIVPGNFLTRDKKFLFCATHGAKFRMDDGYCVDGPCEGESMKPVTLIVENGAVSLDEASYPADANPRDNGVR